MSEHNSHLDNFVDYSAPISPKGITVNSELLSSLSQKIEKDHDLTADFFYRYPEKYDELEDHMRRHIEKGKGNYLVLDVGASTGKEPLSVVMAWEEMVASVNPEYEGTIAVLAVDKDADAIAAFQDNRFPIYGDLQGDHNLERVKKYASLVTPAEPGEGPTFLYPKEYISFPKAMLDKITYIQMDADSPQITELPKVYGAKHFDAAVSYTASRYFHKEEESMQRISNTLGNHRLLSHVR